MYLIVYALLLAAYIGVIFHLARKGGAPDDARPMFPPVMGAPHGVPAE
jgi:hypothetical protein